MRAAVVLAAAAIVACNSSTVSTAYVPWLPLPRGNPVLLAPPPSPPVPIPPGTPRCRAGQLEGELIGRYGALGNTDTPVVIRNRSVVACSVEGTPDVHIVNATGGVLAQAVGDDGVGTYFDSNTSPVPLLMQPNTPPLAPSPDFRGGQALSAGLAFMNIQWSGCPHVRASLLYLDLEDGGGRLTIPFPVDSPCDPVQAGSGVSRGPLYPTGVPWPPASQQISLRYVVDAPASAKRGTTLEFFVTLGNTGTDDYGLAPCPDYSEALVPGGPVSYYQLNCPAVGAIRPGHSVRFQMKFAIPPATPTGPWTLQFGLVDGRITPPGIQAPITITD